MDETWIGKQIRRAPEQFDARAFLFFLQNIRDGVKIFVRLGKRLYPPVKRAVVPAIIWRTELLDEFKRGADALWALLTEFERRPMDAASCPHRTDHCRCRGRCASRPRKTQMVAHRLARTIFVGRCSA